MHTAAQLINLALKIPFGFSGTVTSRISRGGGTAHNKVPVTGRCVRSTGFMTSASVLSWNGKSEAVYMHGSQSEL